MPGPPFARGRALGVPEALTADVALLFGGKTSHLFVQSLAIPGSQCLDIRVPPSMGPPTGPSLMLTTPQPQ